MLIAGAATVYTGNHFAIDALTAVVVAVLMQPIAVPYLAAGRLTAVDRRRAPTNNLVPDSA